MLSRMLQVCVQYASLRDRAKVRLCDAGSQSLTLKFGCQFAYRLGPLASANGSLYLVAFRALHRSRASERFISPPCQPFETLGLRQ